MQVIGRALLRRAWRDRRALALTEFAIALPLLLAMGLTGAEFANYITVKMRMSQIALQVADNAARMGSGNPSGPKTISETDINDVLIGGQLESGGLDVKAHGRIILSDLEPMAYPNLKNQYKIVWQRCLGDAPHASLYGLQGKQNMTGGIGPAGGQVTAQDHNATMFVEVYYKYQPLIPAALTDYRVFGDFDEIASMAVRDQRDLTQVYNTEKATASTC